jgi:hypothetical protein
MALHTMWAHGTAFSPPEFPSTGLDNVDDVPYTDVLGMRRGPGSFWRGEVGNGNWFHVSIPTPVIVGGDQVRLKRVFLKYDVGESNITDVQVWEGSSRIQQFGPFPENKQKIGDHRGALDADNTFVLPNDPLVSSGIGISVRVEFLWGSGQPPIVQFTAAGAEFESQSLRFKLTTWLGRLFRR